MKSINLKCIVLILNHIQLYRNNVRASCHVFIEQLWKLKADNHN